MRTDYCSKGFLFLLKSFATTFCSTKRFFKWREGEGREALKIRIILRELANFGAKQHDKIEVELQRLIFDVG